MDVTFLSEKGLHIFDFIQITSPSTWTNVVPFRALEMLFLGRQMYMPSSEQLARSYVKRELLSREWNTSM